jgi:hypothetical protein
MRFDENGNFIIDDEEIIQDINEPEKEDETKSPRLDLFRDILKNILESNTKLDWDLAKKTYSAFVINRCLANENAFLNLVYKLNRFASSISPEMHYKILHKKIKPKRKRFLGYLKQKNVDPNTHKIAKFFDINNYEMESYLNIIGEKNTKDILKFIENIEKPPKKKNSKK